MSSVLVVPKGSAISLLGIVLSCFGTGRTVLIVLLIVIPSSFCMILRHAANSTVGAYLQLFEAPDTQELYVLPKNWHEFILHTARWAVVQEVCKENY